MGSKCVSFRMRTDIVLQDWTGLKTRFEAFVANEGHIDAPRDIRTRRKFASRWDKMHKCFERLEHWDKELLSLIHNAKPRTDASTGLTSERLRPSWGFPRLKLPPVHARDLLVDLHEVMCGGRDCDCTQQHLIRVCLAPEEVEVCSTQIIVEIAVSSGPGQWQEGNVKILSKR